MEKSLNEQLSSDVSDSSITDALLLKMRKLIRNDIQIQKEEMLENLEDNFHIISKSLIFL